jgi:predicted kinase
MKQTVAESIPETLQGLSIFIEECKKEINRIAKLERTALERYKLKNNNKDYEYKKRGE